MKLLYGAFDRVPSPKGASRHILALLPALAQQGWEVTAVLPEGLGPPPSGPGWRVLPVRGLPAHPLEAALAYGAALVAQAQALGPWAAWQVRDPWAGLPLLEAWGTEAPPLVWEVNGLPSLEWPQHHPGLAQRPQTLARFRSLERQLMAQAGGLIAVSPTTARCLIELGAPPGRLRVAPNGVDAASFRPEALPHPWPHLLHLGAQQPWQGLRDLLRALSLLPGPLGLRVVGPPGKWGAQLQREAQALGLGQRVQFWPPVAPELAPRLLAEASLVALPLDGSARNVAQGACPMKLLEAWAAGRPVIASRLPALEALEGGAGAIHWCPPDRPEALALALDEVWRQPELQASLVQAGLARAKALSWGAQAQACTKAFQALGTGPRSSSA